MYQVYNRESEQFPKNTITLFYEVDFDGDNQEWRVCVENLISILSKDYLIKPINVPKFVAGEDFQELTYKINDQIVKLSCDFLLYSIYVETESIEFAGELKNEIAKEVGWVKC